MEPNYVAINSAQWDKWVDTKCMWTIPISREEFSSAKNGTYSIHVTPLKPVPQSWLGDVKGKKVLALASAGGQQGPILSALGAEVTVFDNSQKQLETEQKVADREGYSIKIIKGDMTQPFPFDNESFDLIINPVSNDFIKDLSLFWKECSRVLKKGGSLIAAFVNPDVYMFDVLSPELQVKYKLPMNPICDLTTEEYNTITSKDGIQFSHTLEEQIGGQLEAGFIITGFYEDKHPVDNQKGYDTYIGAIASKLTENTAIYYVTKCMKY
ncbi:MAG: class I SAM-dependent methyltransferase [Nitrososphaerota archaeon]|nr:class I SAM-dependent methyltransferase [Nitrososphaerota archaeon]